MKEFKPLEYEKEVLDFWNKNKVFDTLKEANKDNKPFYFLQGPPYTSGRLHMGHAWNHAVKDIIIKYKKMTGFDVWNRGGYDMHGLPTERKVMAKFNLKDKDDIAKFGLDNFAKECKKFSTEMAHLMNEDLKRLGVDMDFDNAYMPVDNDYMEGVWWLIKQADKKNRLYEGARTSSWCASCQTGLAKHEQEYKEVQDNSIFVKFPVKGREAEKESLVIWTTTPWTIPFNLAIMINPTFDYVKAEVVELRDGSYNAKVGDVWIVAKELMNSVEEVCKVKLEIREEFKGKKIEGLEYVHPWGTEMKKYAELKKEAPKVHTVLMTEEYCTLDAGSGLVHCAPGCGPEDYEVGYQNNIPPYNSITESAEFPAETGKFKGLFAKKDDIEFIKHMKIDGMLVGKKPYMHDYAHCERCHNPVVFKTTKQWFFKTEDLKKRMIEFNNDTNWVPNTAYNAFNSWLENLRDNSVTKQRFWGTPIPLWKCEDEEDCGHYVVVESAEELEKLGAKNIPKNLHKPWIDKVTMKCEKCGKTMHRLPDVLDVWIDAGSASWNCLYYPKRKDLFERYFPADFILEGKDQIRGWFNLLMVAGIIGFDSPTFKNVYMHGFLTDVDGVKMSKSLGNIVSPYDLIDKFGADTLRIYMSETNAGEDISFSWDEAELRFRNLKILWNVSSFLINLHKDLSINNSKVKPEYITKLPKELPEKFILSKMNATLKQLTNDFETYKIDSLAGPVQELFLELSRTYIKLVRDKAASGTDDEKTEVMNVTYTVLMNVLKMFAPIAPFVSEQIYQNLKEEFGSDGFEKSLIMEKWPVYNDKFINSNLDEDMKIAQDLIGGILSARDKSAIGVRWPLSEAIVVPDVEGEKLDSLKHALAQFEPMIKEQTNVKSIGLGNVDVDIDIKPNFRQMGKDFGQHTATVVSFIKGKEEDVKAALKKGEAYKFKTESKTVDVVEGEKIETVEFALKEDHFQIEKIVPEGYGIGELKIGSIYLVTNQTDDLLAEGFAREIGRRVQALRKDAGLEKSDEISLHVTLDEGMPEAVESEVKKLKSKLGAKEVHVSKAQPNNKFAHNSEAKVKGKKFTVYLSKL